MDFFASEPLLALTRFGRWQEILDEPRPQPGYHVLTALWLHARGFANASLGRIAEADRDRSGLDSLLSSLPPDLAAGNNPANAVVALALTALQARIAEKAGDPEKAISLWKSAVQQEDRLVYNEPADWFNPSRHFLGAVLLDAGRPAEAEAVYQQDLKKHRGNGWALYGLWQAQRALGRSDDARETERRFRTAWALADVSLSRSAY